MTQQLRSGYAAFRPRARLLKLIGAELISDDVVAITELVKNAHDADAPGVTISFHGVTQPGGHILVRDEGCGMDLEAVLGRWMEPAGSSKTGPTRRTPSGRRMLGEKGVGRFAADKLARRLQLVTRLAGEAREVKATFDWDDFDTDTRMLSEIRNRWEVRVPTVIATQGTELRLTDLRCLWTERMFRRLCSRLARLRSPSSDRDPFRIHIESDEFPDYAGELRTGFLDQAPYRIEARFDGVDTIRVALDGGALAEQVWNGAGELTCGPLSVRLYAFDLETEALARVGPRADVRAWLREWCGLSVYRDGFRVWPYGEPHDDWLRLDQRRVNNPTVCLSNNQVIGFVEITRDGNVELVDQTNREGLVNNRALEDLRRLMGLVLGMLEAHRNAQRHPPESRRAPSPKQTAERGMAAATLDRLAKKAAPDMGTELRRVSGRVREATAREDILRRRLVEGYADLGALGQVALGLSAVVQKETYDIRAQMKELRATADRRPATRESLSAIEASLATILDRISLLSPMDSGGAFRRRALDVPAEILSFGERVEAIVQSAGITLQLDVPRRRVLRIEMRPETFHRLLYVLVSNAMDWLGRTRDPRITLQAIERPDHCEVIVQDNGPGISPALSEKVFDPLFSGREKGRGMGLTIARDLVSLNGGTIEIVRDGRRSRGAILRMVFPRKRSRATPH